MTFPGLQRLLAILEKLRGPSGCPWDRQQSLASMSRYMADEVHEYCDAAQADDLPAAREELADLLYLLAFNWQLLNERAPTRFDDLAETVSDKLERRHPHVFGEDTAMTPEESQLLWNQQKAQEKGPDHRPSALKQLSPSVSPLRQAALYGKGAAEVGFEWPDASQALEKVLEELTELRQAAAQDSEDAVTEEAGDLLFAVVQALRLFGVDPDDAMRQGNAKFARRFHQMEDEQGGPDKLSQLDLASQRQAWARAKKLLEDQDGSGQPSSSSTPS